MALVASSALSPAAFAQTPPLVMSEAMVQSSDPGIQLYVRNKHAEDMTSFSPDKTLLFIHGATYPAETSFDLPIEGVSMMDLFAQNGFDVYLVDVRSYGRSTRPPEMDEPPEANKPIATSEEAGARSRRGGRLYSGSARHPETRPHGLVVGHVDRGQLHVPAQRQGQSACSLRAGLDGSVAAGAAGERDPGLSAGEERGRESALDQGRP